MTKTVDAIVHTLFDEGGGLLKLIVPPTWRITSVHPQNLLVDNTCRIISATAAQCKVPANRHQAREFTLIATGPERTNPPQKLHAVYTELQHTKTRDCPLTPSSTIGNCVL